MEGRPINSGPCYYTRGLSLIVHEILLPCLEFIPHILKDTFDFTSRFGNISDSDTGVPSGNVQIATWDIKSLYTNLRHDLFIRAIEYWLETIGEHLPLMNRFSSAFVLETLHIVLKYNYVHIDNKYYHQHKGGAMGAPCMVVGSNLVVAYLEIRMFERMPEVFPQDFVDFFIRNYFRFIDDVIHMWLTGFDINLFGHIINGLDPDIKFELEQIARHVHYLDVDITVTDDGINFDIYYKPTNAFTYLKYNSCHPRHTIENLAGSLARRIINIVTVNRDPRLQQLTDHMVARGHPMDKVTNSISNAMRPHQELNTGEPIVFTRTHSPKLVIDLNKIRNCITNLQSDEMKDAFRKKWVLMSTRQPTNLRKMLTSAKFVRNPIPREPRLVGLFPCGKCKHCRLGYFIAATGFSLVNKLGKVITWTYNRMFSCGSRNVLYVVVCNVPNHFYLGKTNDTLQRCRKHASDVRHPQNSMCRECSEHLRECSDLTEPYFTMYPFFYEDDSEMRHQLERRFIIQWKPHLNGQ